MMVDLKVRDPFDDPAPHKERPSPPKDRPKAEDRQGKKVRVNFELDAGLHRRVKVKAALEDRTIADVAREFFEQWARK